MHNITQNLHRGKKKDRKQKYFSVEIIFYLRDMPETTITARQCEMDVDLLHNT